MNKDTDITHKVIYNIEKGLPLLVRRLAQVKINNFRHSIPINILGIIKHSEFQVSGCKTN